MLSTIAQRGNFEAEEGATRRHQPFSWRLCMAMFTMESCIWLYREKRSVKMNGTKRRFY